MCSKGECCQKNGRNKEGCCSLSQGRKSRGNTVKKSRPPRRGSKVK